MNQPSPVINVKTFLPVIDVVNLLINAIERTVAFTADGLLHQDQRQLSCHQIRCKFTPIFTVKDGYGIKWKKSIFEIQHLLG